MHTSISWNRTQIVLEYDTIVQVHNFKQDSPTKASLNNFMYGKQSEIKGAGFRQTVWQIE